MGNTHTSCYGRDSRHTGAAGPACVNGLGGDSLGSVCVAQKNIVSNAVQGVARGNNIPNV